VVVHLGVSQKALLFTFSNQVADAVLLLGCLVHEASQEEFKRRIGFLRKNNASSPPL
jgi:tRNA A37 methylthiotransferase MiaB